jgi:hypothetical protein
MSDDRGREDSRRDDAEAGDSQIELPRDRSEEGRVPTGPGIDPAWDRGDSSGPERDPNLDRGGPEGGTPTPDASSDR